MSRRFTTTLFAFWFSAVAHAGDPEDASAAASAILQSLNEQKYEFVWESQSSSYLRGKVQRDDFVSSMAIGRAQFGKLVETKMLNASSVDPDPNAGYDGKVFAVNYLNTYAAGKYLERVVLVKEADGRFRLAGLLGRNAPDSAAAPPGAK
jgi:hypothetical protein